MTRLRLLLAVCCAVAMLPSALMAQDRGSVTGQVTEQMTQRPLAGVQVSVAGTQLGTITNAQGRFLIPNVPAGAREVRASLIGYGVQTQPVAVAAGQTATVQFSMMQVAVALDEVVVTGTAGRQERRAQAAVVANINAATVVETAPVTNVSEILAARTTGLSVTGNSGTSGTAQEIRIRGAASLSLSNEPIVFIDGVRADSRATQLYGVGGQQGSRLNDIRPEDIESIEVVKGPAAATLYGADASAGVIQIITKRGRAGSGFTQSLTAEYNSIDANFTPEANFGVCSATHVTQQNRTLCFGQPVGTIVQDNPLVRYDVFRTGQMRSLNWSGRGGGENYGFFLSLGADDEQGTLPSNSYGRTSGRFNFSFIPSSTLRIEAGLGLIQTLTNLPNNDNNIYGYLGGGLLGSPLTVGTANDGWFGTNRQTDAISAIDNRNTALRTTPTFTVSYNPTTWLTNRLNVGADMTRTEAQNFFPRNDFGWYGTAVLNSGQIQQARQNRDSYTIDYLGNIPLVVNPNLTTDISFGGQYIGIRSDVTFATGQGLTTNAANAVSAAATATGGQSFTESRQLGGFGQVQFGWQDRLFLQVAGRLDQASAFGADAPPFFSPKVGVSYVLSDEPFFQAGAPSLVSTVRLRAAWGTTGRSPTTGSIQTFAAAPFAVTTTDVRAGIVPSNPGNPDLRAERGTEFEAGFDAGFFNERVGAEVTYFNKTSRDIILSRPLPPSLGFGQNPFVNIGEMVNRGVEVALNARLVELPSFAWEARLGFNTLHNEITDLGDVEPFGTMNRRVEGRQAGAYHVRTIRQVITDPAQAATLCRAGQTACAVVSDTLEYFGNFLPTFEGSFSSAMTFARNLRLTGNLDWKSDYMIYNNSAQFRERSFGTGERFVRRNEILSPEERVRRFGPFVNEATGAAVNASAVNEEYVERGDFVRLRELALTYSLPGAFAQRMGASGASLTFAGRNLALWTDYTGGDPEISGAPDSDFFRWDFLTVPQARRYVARVNLQF
ncbi:SusC/RagA family TonB-linked outer membrane protein [soil metagenome]